MKSGSKKDITLEYILYIYYLFCLRKNSNNVEDFIDSTSIINIKTSIYTLKLGI